MQNGLLNPPIHASYCTVKDTRTVCIVGGAAALIVVASESSELNSFYSIPDIQGMQSAVPFRLTTCGLSAALSLMSSVL